MSDTEAIRKKLVDLNERFQRTIDLCQGIDDITDLKRVYLKPGQKAPSGRKTGTSKDGRSYYESIPRSEYVRSRSRNKYAPTVSSDDQMRMDRMKSDTDATIERANKISTKQRTQEMIKHLEKMENILDSSYSDMITHLEKGGFKNITSDEFVSINRSLAKKMGLMEEYNIE